MKNVTLLISLIFTISMNGQHYSRKQLSRKINEINKQNASEDLKRDNGRDVSIFSFGLRKSAKDYLTDLNSKLAKQGAVFVFTKPKNKTSSYIVNAGLVLGIRNLIVLDSVIKYEKTSFSLDIQWDRNTLIDNEQNNLMSGIAYKNTFVIYNRFKSRFGKNKKKLNFPLVIKSTFRKDFENDIDALQNSVLIQPRMIQIDKDDKLVAVSFPLVDNLNFGLEPIIGLEYDYRFNSEVEQLEGNLLRSYAQIKGVLTYMKYISAFVGFENRQLLINESDFDSKSFSLTTFKIESKIKINSKENFWKDISPTIGIFHQNGENPTNGFNKQSFWSLTLSISI